MSAIRASDITMRRVDWLWAPYVPLGKVSVIAGQMGQAKSLFTAWLAARTTREGGHVLMLNAEDDPADTGVPRLHAAGANVELVSLSEDWTLDAKSIEQQCDAHPNLRLITVDPVTAFFASNVDSWKNQAVRRALEPLRRLAQERGIAVLLVLHINRRGDTTDALSRISDSQGIPALARSVLIWGPDPSDPEGDLGASKVLTRPKGNLARGTTGAAFIIEEQRVTEDITAPRLRHLGDSVVRAEDVVSSESVRNQTDAAIVFLQDLLADGPQEVDAIKQAAEVAEIGEKALRKARERLCRSYRPQGNHGPYVWELKGIKREVIQGHSGATTGNHGGVNDRECLNDLSSQGASATDELARLRAKFEGVA